METTYRNETSEFDFYATDLEQFKKPILWDNIF